MSEKHDISHAGHRQRLRSRFVSENGLDSFQKHNSLELLLFYAIPRMDTNELAHRLIDTFGSLKGVFDAPIDALKKVDGVGENTAILIKLIPALFREYLNDEAKGIDHIMCTEDAVKYLKPKFACLKTESFVMICLNHSYKILKSSVISEGGIDFTQADIRKIMSEVLNSHATSVIIAHNHPGGLCVPSRSDRDVTLNIAKILDTISVRLINHIIMTEDEYFSLAEHPNFSDCFNPRSQIKYARESYSEALQLAENAMEEYDESTY